MMHRCPTIVFGLCISMATVREVVSQVSRHIIVKLCITSTALLHRHKLALHVPRIDLHTYSND